MTEKILVPIDLVDMSIMEKVLKAAVQQAKASKGELTVMTVVPKMITGIDYRYAIRGEMGGSEEYDAKAIVQEALDRLNEITGGINYGARAGQGSSPELAPPLGVTSPVAERRTA